MENSTMQKEVDVYRLWPDHTWDIVSVFVDSEPWLGEIVESRACAAAWENVAKTHDVSDRPLRMGLFTIVYDNRPEL